MARQIAARVKNRTATRNANIKGKRSTNVPIVIKNKDKPVRAFIIL
jgi:hypothetical protein